MDSKRTSQEGTASGSTKTAAQMAAIPIALAAHNKKTDQNISYLKAYFSKAGKNSNIKR